MISKLFLIFFALAYVLNARAEAIHVLVWDERQPRQAEAYENFLGNEISKQLTASAKGLELRSAALDDPEQGLTEDNLKWADVLIWWGHAAHGDVDPVAIGKFDELARNIFATALNRAFRQVCVALPVTIGRVRIDGGGRRMGEACGRNDSSR